MALLVFGPHRLPEVGRQVGGAMRELRKIQDTVRGELDTVLHPEHGTSTSDVPWRARRPHRERRWSTRRSSRGDLGDGDSDFTPPDALNPDGTPTMRTPSTTKPASSARPTRSSDPAASDATPIALPAEASVAGTMPLTEHLIELRRRILISFACDRALRHRRVPRSTTRCSTSCRSPTGRDAQHQGCGPRAALIVTDPLTPLLVRLKISLYGGLALSVPIVMWQIWRFIVPGLNQNERRYAFGFFFGGIVLFLLGCVVAWFTVTKALDFLLGVGGSSLRPLIDANKYLTLVLLMFAAFGFSFEFPLLLMFLLLVGVVNTRQLRNEPAVGRGRDHHVCGRHHAQPGSVLPIVHGRSPVHLL